MVNTDGLHGMALQRDACKEEHKNFLCELCFCSYLATQVIGLDVCAAIGKELKGCGVRWRSGQPVPGSIQTLCACTH